MWEKNLRCLTWHVLHGTVVSQYVRWNKEVTSCFSISVHSVINIIIILAGAIALIIGFGISGMCYPITVRAVPSLSNIFSVIVTCGKNRTSPQKTSK